MVCSLQTSMEVGAVCDLQDIKEAVLTARLVMEHTQHSMLAGLSAANFAVQMGLSPANLTTEASSKQHAEWCFSAILNNQQWLLDHQQLFHHRLVPCLHDRDQGCWHCHMSSRSCVQDTMDADCTLL